MGSAHQFALLLWKNYLLQKRQLTVTLVQMIIPVLFAALLIALRILPRGADVPTPTTWNPFSIPSVTSPDQGCILYYSPNTSSLTRTIMEGVVKRIGSINETLGFDSETSLVRDFIEKLEEKQGLFNQSDAKSFININSCDVLAAVVFLELPSTDLDDSESADNYRIKYKLRFPSTLRTSVPYPGMGSSRWNTELVFPDTETIGPRDATDYGGPPDYVSESFLTLQYSVDMAIIEVIKNDSYHQPDELMDLQMERFPFPPYKTDTFIMLIQRLFPLLIMLGLFLWSMLIVRDIVYEKEQRLKESMQMMGLDRNLHWLAWFFRYLFLLATSVSVETCLLVFDIGAGGPVLRCISPLLLFAFLMSYGVATIAFCLAVSALFSRANLATAVGGLLFVISYVPYFFLQPCYDSVGWPLKVGVCFLSNMAMAFGTQVIGEHESSGDYLGWATINVASSAKDFTLLYVLLLLWIDAMLYCVFAWYTDAVFPGEYGIPKPWNFPFQNLWRQLTSHSKAISRMELELRKDDGLSDEDSEADEFVPLVTVFSTDEALDKDNFEPDPIGVTPGILMHNLNKEFCLGSSKRTAVAGLTLNVYEGQITVLLGHNGAGKSTTFSILTGLYPPSSGKAFVNGFDIAKNMDLVRHSLGICPQTSVLFDSLTVEEHLVFFRKLKGSSVVQTNDEVAQMMTDVGLLSKRSAPVSTLSGGMKRKLSVGIAFIGGSKVVILDEPTSGMDPFAQRQTWNLIRRCRPGRTILLSTHSMDEAEVLGDRIAIMVNGSIKCCGSPMFLKNKYGSGYRLTVDKYPDCNVSRLTDFVTSYIPQAELKCSLGADVSYLLPHNSRGKFAELFDGIDREKEQLRIAVYGISMATLEEVFIRVGRSLWSNDETDGNSPLLGGQKSTDEEEELLPNSDQLVAKRFQPSVSRCHEWSRRFQVCFRHFCAMFKKKVLHTMRNRQVAIAQFLVPLVFVTLPLLFARGLLSAQDSPALVMDLSIFSDPVVVYGFGVASNPDSDLANFASNYSSGFDADVTLVNVNSRLGAKLCGTMRKYLVGEGKKSFWNYVRHFEIAICLSRLMSENLSLIQAIAFFNNEAYHTSAVSLNAFDNAVLRYTMGSSRWKIQTINHPLPRTSEESLKDQATQGGVGSTIVFRTVIGMSFLTTGFLLFLIRERFIGAKRCQLTSGASAWSFWPATFLCDWIFFELLSFGVVASFAVFHIQPFASDGNWMYVALLFALYGWAMLPLVYLASLCFAVPSSGFIWLTVVNIMLVSLTSVVGFLASMGLDLLYIMKTSELVSHLVPNYGLMKGLGTLYTNYNLRVLCQRDDIVFSCSMQASHPCCKATCGEHCFVYSENPLGMDSRSGIGQVLLFLAFDGLLYFVILLLVDSGRFRIYYYRIQDAMNFLKRKFSNSQSDENDLPEDDDDVATERRRINETPQELLIVTEVVLLKELTKSFGRLVAVDRLSLGISEGECFGLLGVNGAGKTTVFEMIVGDKFISKGLAFLCGQDIKRRIGKVGYCPQTDALIDELTGRELLSLYACLRGVNSKSIRLSVQYLIDALLLQTDADRLVKTYSGGTKRKLSTAVALIGWPRVILLDEPSSGLDPVARRHLWNTLLKLRESKRTVILSTHSMDECETLCTRLAIMVNGRFQCLSSSQHLKNTFSPGFALSVKLPAGTEANISDETTAQVKTFLKASLPGSSFKDVENSILLCCVSDESVRLSQIFRTMETLQSRLPVVEDYSVTQATLEQIFVSFAKAQLPSRPAISWAKCWKRTICRFVCSCFRHCWSTYVKKRQTRSSSH